MSSEPLDWWSGDLGQPAEITDEELAAIAAALDAQMPEVEAALDRLMEEVKLCEPLPLPELPEPPLFPWP